MKIDASELSEIEQDALAEIANMGVSSAAASLRRMVGEQVLLSVPAVIRRSWLLCSNRSKGCSRVAPF